MMLSIRVVYKMVYGTYYFHHARYIADGDKEDNRVLRRIQFLLKDDFSRLDIIHLHIDESEIRVQFVCSWRPDEVFVNQHQ